MLVREWWYCSDNILVIDNTKRFLPDHFVVNVCKRPIADFRTSICVHRSNIFRYATRAKNRNKQELEAEDASDVQDRENAKALTPQQQEVEEAKAEKVTQDEKEQPALMMYDGPGAPHVIGTSLVLMVGNVRGEPEVT